MRIFHRLDDIGKYNKNIVKIIDIFELYTKEYILAIIPSQLDLRMIGYLRQLNKAIFYQHGYEHVNRVNKGWKDEFPQDLGSELAFEKLLKGKRILENVLGTKIYGYVPPWNNTSLAAINALKSMGFEVYSASENNSVSFLNNRDILVDIVESYFPFILYKKLDSLYEEIKAYSNSYRHELGVMYHFDEEFNELDDVVKFIKNIELLNGEF